MTTAGAFALGVSEVAFFPPPPIRPPRSRRTTGRDGIITTMVRAIRHELAHATAAPVTDWMPRVTNYPY